MTKKRVRYQGEPTQRMCLPDCGLVGWPSNLDVDRTYIYTHDPDIVRERSTKNSSNALARLGAPQCLLFDVSDHAAGTMLPDVDEINQVAA